MEYFLRDTKIIDITDYFDPEDESINPPFIPNYSEAKSEISNLISNLSIKLVKRELSQVNKKSYQHLMIPWGGAGVSISSPKVGPDDRYINVISKDYKYISWAYSKMAIVFRRYCISRVIYSDIANDLNQSFISEKSELAKSKDRGKYLYNLVYYVFSSANKHIIEYEREDKI